MSANKGLGVLRKQSRMAKNDGVQIPQIRQIYGIAICPPHGLGSLLLPHLYYLQTGCSEKCPQTKGTKPFHSSKSYARVRLKQYKKSLREPSLPR